MSDSFIAFRQGYPIDFDLYDKDQQNVLYIEDRPADQQVKLEITNASAETIQLAKLPDSAVVGPAAYHFALRFRPGTLADASLAGEGKIKLSPESEKDWTMSDPVKDTNGMDLLYFLDKTQLSFEPQKKITIALLNVGADGAQGARGTRVELLYDNMAYQSTPEHNLKSTRIAHLSIINHRGKTHSPLHAGFVGSDTVLNDGASPNTLKLRITNLLRPDPDHPGHDRITFKYNADEANASKLILSFDTGPSSEEWALGSAEQVKAIEVRQPPDWKISKLQEGESPEWILQPESEDQTLDGTKHLELTLSNIITDYPTGPTHLYLRYENIPGYWDGQFVCVIEKQPLVYRDNKVGIGTADPGGKLDVHGNLFVDGEIIKLRGKNVIIDLSGNGGGKLLIMNDKDDNRIYLEGLSSDGNGSADIITICGILNNPVPQFTVNADKTYISGNVGIGTTEPMGKLDVNGNIVFNGSQDNQISKNDIGRTIIKGKAVILDISPNGGGQLYIANNPEDNKIYIEGYSKDGMSSADEMLLTGRCDSPVPKFTVKANETIISGNVGIGTTAPTAKLQVINRNQDANGDTLVLGPKDASNLRLGYDTNYSWIQSHGSKPLAINPLGNNVGIGTTAPKERLEVEGNIKGGGNLTVDGNVGIGTSPHEASVYGTGNIKLKAQTRIESDGRMHITGEERLYLLNKHGVFISKSWGGNGNLTVEGSVGTHGYPPVARHSDWSGGIHTKYIEAAAKIWSGEGIIGWFLDYAEYFESLDGKEIPPAVSVVLENGKIRPAKQGEIPIGVISPNPGVLGGDCVEWPEKYLLDEFGNQILEEYQEEIMAPKKIKIKKERQKMEKKKIKEKVTKTEIAFENGKYFQKEISETVEREIEEPVFEEHDLYDAQKKNIIGKHKIPVMETYEEEIDVLDDNGRPVMVGTGKFETRTRPRLNPEYDEKKEYISREKRPEWNCVGLLGQLRLRKGQPTSPTWVKMKDISDNVELWLVK